MGTPPAVATSPTELASPVTLLIDGCVRLTYLIKPHHLRRARAHRSQRSTPYDTSPGGLADSARNGCGVPSSSSSIHNQNGNLLSDPFLVGLAPQWRLARPDTSPLPVVSGMSASVDAPAVNDRSAFLAGVAHKSWNPRYAALGTCKSSGLLPSRSRRAFGISPIGSLASALAHAE